MFKFAAYLTVKGLNSLSCPTDSLSRVFDSFHQHFLPYLGISPNNVTEKIHEDKTESTSNSPSC